MELRNHPETVTDARRALLGSDTSRCWEMQEALLILARAGTAEAVPALGPCMPVAHTRAEGFTGYALDRGFLIAL